jgi:hypothetical protein
MGLPAMQGSPITISFQPELTEYRGKLLSAHPELGTAVHAASFIRERRVVLERELLTNPALLRLILVHEFFHFIWPCLSNELRESYSGLLETELGSGARGEIGESSSVRKDAFAAGGRCWKEYVCESFCDTGAWLYSGIERHRTFRLAIRWQKARRNWFRGAFERYWNMRCS